METIGSWWMWVGLGAIFPVMRAIDPFVLGGREHRRISTREAAVWSGLRSASPSFVQASYDGVSVLSREAPKRSRIGARRKEQSMNR